ncbi:hypothetical protein C7S16_1851 [Burkholderia thailandensis]|uniref:Uncharacterized protein n=1 Tax=Burkholderia thailandensis TaxID=57975 RepID=A0AAW9D1M6_BURTH|nr:hypothetical protein [Burkholderia thailandensis]MDW9253959.1 hypothetical protein [Burkholderia thailandensis]
MRSAIQCIDHFLSYMNINTLHTIFTSSLISKIPLRNE